MPSLQLKTVVFACAPLLSLLVMYRHLSGKQSVCGLNDMFSVLSVLRERFLFDKSFSLLRRILFTMHRDVCGRSGDCGDDGASCSGGNESGLRGCLVA